MQTALTIAAPGGNLPPAFISIPHPLVAEGREMSYAAFQAGETLGAYIERTGINVARGAIAAWHNGRRIPDHLWTRLIPKTGDQIIVRSRAEGGGGGNKVLRTVALVVVAIAAAASGGAAAGAAGFVQGTAGYAAASAVVSAAVVVAGSLIVTSLIPEVQQ